MAIQTINLNERPEIRPLLAPSPSDNQDPRIQKRALSSLEALKQPAAAPNMEQRAFQKIDSKPGSHPLLTLLGIILCIIHYGFGGVISGGYKEEDAKDAYMQGRTLALRGMLVLGVSPIAVAKEAIRLGDAKTLKLICEEYPYKKYPVNMQQMAFAALSENRLDILQTLMQAGVPVTAKKDEKTLMQAACEQKNLAAMKLLFEKGASVDGLKNILPALLQAGQEYRPLALKLIEEKIDLDCVDDAKNALMIAFEQKDQNLALLLAQNKVPFFVPRNQTNLLSQAYDQGWFDVLAALVKNLPRENNAWNNAHFGPYALLHAADAQGRTLLHRAVIDNQIEAAKALMEHPSLLNQEDQSGRYAMHYACEKGRKEIFDQLIFRQGVHRFGADIAGNTPLSLAFLSGHIEMAERLVQNRAPLRDGQTFLFDALHKPEQRPHLICLIKAGVTTNTHDSQGKKLLHAAAFCGDTEVLSALLDKGALVNEEDDNGLTPIEYAIRNKKFAAAKFLYEKEGNLSAAMHEASRFDAKTILRLVAELGNVPGQAYYPLACASGNLDLVKHAEKNGAQATVRDSEGLLPIHHAARAGHYDTVMYLCPKVNDLSDDSAGRTSDLQTVLHLAALSANAELVAQLSFVYPELLALTDLQGKTALDVAQNHEVRQALKQAIQAKEESDKKAAKEQALIEKNKREAQQALEKAKKAEIENAAKAAKKLEQEKAAQEKRRQKAAKANFIERMLGTYKDVPLLNIDDLNG